MALDKLVDSTKLDACMTAEANAIRAKTGGSADIPFDFANNKGFADAIAAIPSGGGDPWELIADYTSDAAATIVAAEIPLDYQNEPLYKVEILAEFDRPEYPYAYINSTSSGYEPSARSSDTPYLYTGYISQGQRFDNNVRTVTTPYLALSGMAKSANYPILNVGLKAYYENAIKAGCNIKVWRFAK